MKRLGTLAAVAGLATFGIAAVSHDAKAWVRFGVGVFAPPVVVAPPPVYYAPPPVYYAPPPVAYAPPPRHWIPAHWHGPYWVPGHWS